MIAKKYILRTYLKEFMHKTTSEKNIDTPEPEKEIFTRRKEILCIYMPREDNFVVHERVKKNVAIKNH